MKKEIEEPGGKRERFWERVRIGGESECWEWEGSKDRNGYGRFYYREGGKWRKERASRVAWELGRGPIPRGCVIHHECRNKGCENPEHLRLVGKGDHTRLHLAGRRVKQCVHGHEYNAENTRWDRRGYRNCRECERRSGLEYYYRHHQAARVKNWLGYWKNRSKKLAAARRSRRVNHEAVLERTRAWKRRNKERVAESNRKWREEHPGYRSSYGRWQRARQRELGVSRGESREGSLGDFLEKLGEQKER